MCPEGHLLPPFLCQLHPSGGHFGRSQNPPSEAYKLTPILTPLPPRSPFAPPIFLDLSLEFSTFFRLVFSFLGVPYHGGDEANLRAPGDFNLCHLHAFTLQLSGCDLLAGGCNGSEGGEQNQSMQRVLTNFPPAGGMGVRRFQLVDESSLMVHLVDDLGNWLRVDENEQYAAVEVYDNVGNFIVVNETDSDSSIEAQDSVGNRLLMWEDADLRRVKLRDFRHSVVDDFKVELVRSNFSCFYCNCGNGADIVEAEKRLTKLPEETKPS